MSGQDFSHIRVFGGARGAWANHNQHMTYVSVAASALSRRSAVLGCLYAFERIADAAAFREHSYGLDTDDVERLAARYGVTIQEAEYVPEDFDPWRLPLR